MDVSRKSPPNLRAIIRKSHQRNKIRSIELPSDAWNLLVIGEPLTTCLVHDALTNTYLQLATFLLVPW